MEQPGQQHSVLLRLYYLQAALLSCDDVKAMWQLTKLSASYFGKVPMCNLPFVTL